MKFRRLPVVVFLVLMVAFSYGARRSKDKQIWTPLGLAGGGGMFSVGGSPHDHKFMMLSCDMSGAYFSEDSAENWTMINHAQLRGSTTCPPLFHPTNEKLILAVSGRTRIKYSTDKARTWTDLSDSRPFKSPIYGLYISEKNPNWLFAGTEKTLWRTKDKGQNWEKCEDIEGKFISMSSNFSRKASQNEYFVGTSKGIFYTKDCGKSFEKIMQGLPAQEITAFHVGSNKKTTILYAATLCKVVNDKLEGGVYVSEDEGETWKSVMANGLNVETKRNSRWANGDVPKYMFAMTTNKKPQIAYIYSTGTSYFPPNHNTVYKTENAGKTWNAVFFSDPRMTRLYNMEDDRTTLAIGQRYQSAPTFCAINPTNPNIVMMNTAMYLFYTLDGGRTWKVSQGDVPLKVGDSHALKCNGLTVTTTWNYYIDPFEKKRHYICYTDIGFARSIDAGKTWIWEGYRLPWHNTTYELAFDPKIKGKIWGAFSNTHDIPNENVISGRHRVIMEGGVALSTDFGHTWEKSTLPEGPCTSIIIDPESKPNKRRLYASVFEKGVYKSVDDGKTWELKSKGLGCEKNMRSCKLLLHSDGTLFNLITAKKFSDTDYDTEGVGLYRSTDGAENWERINKSQTLRWVKDFTVHPENSKYILMGACNVRGHAEGGLYRTLDGGVTWERIVQKASQHFGAAFHPTKKGWIYMTLTEGASEAGLYLSKDDGKTWTPFLTLPFSNIQRVHFDPDDEKEIILTTFGGSVFRGPCEPVK